MLLDRALFTPLSAGPPSLQAAAAVAYGGPIPPRRASNPASTHRKRPGPFIADALLFTSSCKSWGQPIVPDTLSKVLEWGQNSGFVGAGNQLTERGLLLKSLFAPAVERFVQGDPCAWNPFDITPVERAFFFYHLGEQDEILWDLAFRAGLAPDETSTIDTSKAHRLTRDALKALVARADAMAPLHERPILLRLRDLVGKIAHEINPEAEPPLQRAGPRPPAKRPSDKDRQTTKSADHEAIPRCEILVDLGILSKTLSPKRDRAKEMKAWSFTVTAAGRAMAAALREVGQRPIGDWHWRSFAQTLAASGLVSDRPLRTGTAVEAFELFREAYEATHRLAGHTPFDTVGIRTIIAALVRGIVVEISHLHDVLLHAKRSGALDASISFAGANEIEKMFVLLRPSFASDAKAWLERQQWASAPADRPITPTS